jgi:hypothetical protein
MYGSGKSPEAKAYRETLIVFFVVFFLFLLLHA